MQLFVVHQHWLAVVLVVMRHRVESLGVVEANDEEGACSDEVLLEWHGGHVRLGKFTLAGEEGVFVSIELLLYISSEHLQIN